MAITRVNSASVGANSGGATAYTAALGVAVQAGDIIVIAAGSQGTHATNGMAATMTATGEAFTTILETQGGNASSRWLQTFKYRATQAFTSADTITFTPYAASTQNAFSVDIFRGADTAVDQAVVGQSNASGTNTAPALGANAAAGSLVLTFVQTAAGTLTAGSPFSTGSTSATNEATAVGFVLGASGASTYASTWTLGTAGTNSTQTVSLQAVVTDSVGQGSRAFHPGRGPTKARFRKTPQSTDSPAAAPPPVFVQQPPRARVRPPPARRARIATPVPASAAAPCTPPVFGSIGTLHGATTSSPAFAVPASVASGDTIVVAFYADVSTTTVTGFPAGFAHAEGSPRTVNAGGTNNHVLNVCWKRATGADAGTYTFTLSATVFVYGNAVRYTGTAASGNPWDSPTSAADGGASLTNTTPAVSASTAGDNRLWFFAGSNWNGDSGTWSPPSGFNQRQGGVNTTNLEISDKTQVTQGSSGTVQASDTTAGQSGAWLGALIGTCPTTVFPPPPGIRHRLFPIRPVARTRSAAPVPPQVTPATPGYPPAPVHARVRSLRLSHARSSPPVPPQESPPAVPVPRRARLAAARRRPVVQVPPDQATVWQALRARLRLGRPVRPHVAVSPLAQAAPVAPAYPPAPSRGKTRGLRLFRPRTAAPVPPQIAVVPPTYPPAPAHARVRSFRLFRARAATPVPAQATVAPPAYPPQGWHARVKALRWFRARTAAPVPPQVGVAPPTFVALRARQVMLRQAAARRPHAVVPPVRQESPPLVTRLRLRVARIFRGRSAAPVPPQVFPPPYPPAPAHARRFVFGRRRPGRAVPLGGTTPPLWTAGMFDASATVAGEREGTGTTGMFDAGATASSEREPGPGTVGGTDQGGTTISGVD